MGLCLCGSVCVVHKGLDGSLDILTGADALQHVPPLGTCGCPARSDLVVVAQISHELAVLAHDLVVGVDIAHAGADREVGGSQHTVLDLIGVGSDEVDGVPKKPGLDELLAWLDEQHIPMAVASSSRMDVIQRNLDNWGMRSYFSVLASGQQVTRSKPDPEIFLLAAEKLGVTPGHALVLEDSYNGVRAGAAGGFVTVMVPDLLPADDEMRRLYTAECRSLFEVLDGLKANRW